MLDKDLYGDQDKKYAELSATEKIQADCDLKATNIILQGLPFDIYLLVNHHRVAKDLWERIQLPMQGTSLTKQERECKLYDAFDKFAHIKGESLHQYYLRFTQLINDMNIYKMKLEQFQVNTKFLNSLPPEWSKFVTDVKLVKDLHSTNFDQLHAYLQQHELYANEVCIMRERNHDPLALVSNHQQTLSHFNTYQSSYNNPQFQQQFSPSQSPQYGSIHPIQHFSSTHPSTPLIDYSLAVPVFKQGNDPIDAINKMMSFLSNVVSSHFPTTNNQLRNSSNPRQQATIHDGRVTVHPVQGRQESFAAGTSRTRANISGTGRNNSGQQRVMKCFNCQGDGHMAKQCPKPNRRRDATWFRDKVLLVEAQRNGKVLNEEELEFLADPEVAEAKAILMANLSSYGSDVLSEVPHFEHTHNNMLNQSVQEMQYSEQTHLVNYPENEIISDSYIIPYSQYLLETQNAAVQDTNSSAQQDAMILSDKEAKSIDTEIALEKKVKELDNIICKMGQSAQIVHMLTKPQVFYDNNLNQALGFQNPFYLKKAQQIRPILYDGNVTAKETNVISIADSEETLMLEEENFGKCFVLQRELSDEQALHPNTDQSSSSPVKIEAPQELSKHVDTQCFEIQDIVNIVVNSSSDINTSVNVNSSLDINTSVNVNSSVAMNDSVNYVEMCNTCLKLEVVLIKQHNMVEKDEYNKLSKQFSELEQHSELQAKDTTIEKLKTNIKRLNKTSTTNNVKKDIDEIETINIELEHTVMKLIAENEHLKQTYKQLYDSIKPSRVQDKEHAKSLVNQLNQKYVEITDLNAQLQEKVFVTTALKNDLRKFKGKDIVDNAAQASNATTIAPGMYKLDLVTLAPKDKNNRKTHIYYLKHTMEHAAILRTCLDIHKPSEKLVVVTPINKKKMVRFAEPVLSSSTSQKSKSTDNKKNDRTQQISSETQKKNKVEDHSRIVTSSLNKTNCVVELSGNANVQHSKLNTNSELMITATNKVPLREPIPLKVIAQESVISNKTEPDTSRGSNTSVAPSSSSSVILRHGLVRGLPKLKFEKDDLCLACAMGKSKKQSHKPKSEDTNQEKLYLLHMDLSSKDEALDFIIKFMKMIQVRLNATVRNICTDNGTEFVNQTLRDYYEQVGISHETSVARTPQQNGVVERRNHMLVEAAHTIRHGKTPYELLHDRKPDLSYLHVFGALCYPNNDSENLGKLQAKADIGIFIGYAPKKKAYRIYNRRTRNIIENIHVDFDELTAMASEQLSSGLGLQFMTLATSSSGLVPNSISQQPFTVANAPRAVDLANSYVSTSIDQDALSTSIPSTQDQEHSPIISQGFEESPKTPHFHDDPLYESLHEDLTSQGSLSNVRPIHTPFELLGRWTKDHPIANVIGDPSLEPKNFKQTMTKPLCIDAMQEEIHEFETLQVWELVPCPDKVMLIKLKWIYKVKSDEFGGDNPSHVYKLKKALYGFKQAPHAWYDMLSSFLILQYFSKGAVDPTLFIWKVGNNLLLVQIYVDDIIFASTNTAMCNEFANLMTTKFKMSMMGQMSFFLGLQISQSPRGIFLNQSKYASEIIKKYGMLTSDSVDTPMVEKSKLDEDLQGKPVDATLYRGMIGSLMYLTSSRPDLIYAVCLCARYQAKPTEKHLNAVKRIFQYLKGTINMGLWYSKDTDMSLTAYADADHGRAKHIDVRYHFIKEHVENRTVELYFIRTEYQLADIFTKPLPREEDE
ncbi:retrovirus-related pol polyprotein from transposon TNT 1-94 [Tanacetum coccineum]